MQDNTYAQILNLRGLAPLNAGTLAGDEDLAALIAEHNARAARIGTRVGQLDTDRRRLADFSVWQAVDGATVLAERARLRREGWDVLRETRDTLQERESVLRQLEERLFAQYQAAEQEHDLAVRTAERRLAPERRALLKTVPATAGSHFADLIENDESVDACATRLAAARRVFEETAAARRNLASDVRAVVARQREQFASMLD
ncbi:MAG: hypothetical protein HZB38_15495 [Planctomycetes bacterium]|nr:hypothetical protein [Planctomycetota bacterium]